MISGSDQPFADSALLDMRARVQQTERANDVVTRDMDTVPRSRMLTAFGINPPRRSSTSALESVDQRGHGEQTPIIKSS